jgi:hypothetical protein
MAKQVQSVPVGRSSAQSQPDSTVKTGMITTSAGPLVWSRDSDGTVKASGNGQQLIITGDTTADGSSDRQLVYSRTGQNPYLTIEGVAQESQRAVALTLTAGQSHLALALTNFDRAVTSATATVSGSLAGPLTKSAKAVAASATPASKIVLSQPAQAINWTGPVDLTKNPLVGTPIPGWPAHAFASELEAAAFFAPLEKELVAPAAVQPKGGTTGGAGGRGRHHADSDTLGDILRGLAWGVGAAVGTAVGGAVAVIGGEVVINGGAIILGGLVGFETSWVSDMVSNWQSQTQPSAPPPPDVPTDPEETSTRSSSTTQDSVDGPGGDGGGGEGGGGKVDDDKPAHEQN